MEYILYMSVVTMGTFNEILRQLRALEGKQVMDVIILSPERRLQLEEYAKRRGQDPAAALDEALGAYLEWEQQDYAESVEGIQRGYEDVLAGRTRSAEEILQELSQKHGFPR